MTGRTALLAAPSPDDLWSSHGGPMNIIADHGVRRGRKFDQVLDGARKIFLRDGFERASVDDIAREAGVSKATIYAYFPDKQLLFLEVARCECHRQAEDAEASIGGEIPVRVALTIAAERITAFLLSDFGQRMFRIVVGEGERFPGLGRQFYDFGPGLIHERLAHHLRCYVEGGQLAIDDIDLAADQFAQLCKATIHEKLIFGMAEAITPDMAHRSVHGAVDMFLARYGVKKG
jgi:TetR/AcrR family transcriptional repressor of mexJK operon